MDQPRNQERRPLLPLLGSAEAVVSVEDCLSLDPNLEGDWVVVGSLNQSHRIRSTPLVRKA